MENWKKRGVDQMAILNQDTTIGGVKIYDAIAGGGKVYGPVTTTGTGSAYIATIEDGPESLYTGLLLVIVPHETSTTVTPTLNVNSLGAKKLYLYEDDTTIGICSPGRSDAYYLGAPLLLMYDGNYFRVLNFNEVSWSNINSKPSIFNPSSHASSSTTYGAGTPTYYGHVRLGNNLTQSSSGQYALDAYQGKVLNDKIGNLSSLSTSADSNLVAAINECFQDASNGKTSVVNALLAKGATGITTSSTWAQIVSSINNLETGGGEIGAKYLWPFDNSNESEALNGVFLGTLKSYDISARSYDASGSVEKVWRLGKTPYFVGLAPGSSNYNGRAISYTCSASGTLSSSLVKTTHCGVNQKWADDYYVHHNGNTWIANDGTISTSSDRGEVYARMVGGSQVVITSKPSGVTSSSSYALIHNLACTSTGTATYLYSVIRWNSSSTYYLYKNTTYKVECPLYDFMEGHPSADTLFCTDGKTLDIYKNGSLSKTVTLTTAPTNSNPAGVKPLQVVGSYLVVATSTGFDKYSLEGVLVKANDTSYYNDIVDDYGNYVSRTGQIMHLPKNGTFADATPLYGSMHFQDSNVSYGVKHILSNKKMIVAIDLERGSEIEYWTGNYTLKLEENDY